MRKNPHRQHCLLSQRRHDRRQRGVRQFDVVFLIIKLLALVMTVTAATSAVLVMSATAAATAILAVSVTAATTAVLAVSMTAAATAVLAVSMTAAATAVLLILIHFVCHNISNNLS